MKRKTVAELALSRLSKKDKRIKDVVYDNDDLWETRDKNGYRISYEVISKKEWERAWQDRSWE